VRNKINYSPTDSCNQSDDSPCSPHVMHCHCL